MEKNNPIPGEDPKNEGANPAGTDSKDSEPKEQENKDSEPKEDGDETKDKHGQPGINREKYQRDMQAKDDEIAELRAQVDELAKTEEGRAEAQKRIDELEQTIKDDRLNFELEKAGCLNVKAGKALLEDYEGDVEKLKEGCPYLFSEGKKQTGSTGAKPAGAPENKVDEELDRIFGTK